MSRVKLYSQAELSAVPDGTIISWDRIPGDHTSAAVAFVRQAMEYPGIREDQEAGIREQPERITWISPGGWDPQTIETAGVTYPVEVVRWGSWTAEIPPPPEPEPLEHLAFVPGFPAMTTTLATGGTWAREKALECASRLWEGQAWVQPATVIDVAAAFEEWLLAEGADESDIVDGPDGPVIR